MFGLADVILAVLSQVAKGCSQYAGEFLSLSLRASAFRSRLQKHRLNLKTASNVFITFQHVMLSTFLFILRINL